MTPNEVSKSPLLDILFEHRNKDYGAYNLRKYYENRLSLAITIMLGVIMLAIFLVSLFNHQSPTGIFSPKPDVVLDMTPQHKAADPETPRPKAAKAGAPQSTIQSTNHIQIVDGPTTVQPTDVLAGAQPGITTTTVTGPPGPPFTPGDPVTSVAAPVAPTDPGIPDGPTQDPSFPGGVKGWANFLGANLVAPGDMQAGEKRSLLVRFWVSEDGSVTRFEVLQSAGASFDNEVLRVLRKMPRWKPALQHGRAVATSFVQPVTFQAPEE
jgi:protein TonB